MRDRAAIAADVLECALGWEPNMRLIGNVQAAEVAYLGLPWRPPCARCKHLPQSRCAGCARSDAMPKKPIRLPPALPGDRTTRLFPVLVPKAADPSQEYLSHEDIAALARQVADARRVQ